jgi:hypothetical protein
VSKAIIVVDFAYKGTQRKGYGTGRKGLSSTLKYLQYRDKVQNQLAQSRDYERWQDRGMGQHWRDILKTSDALRSKHVLAWTWVISPAPDLMELIPEDQRRDLVCDLTEHVVEEYYTSRGFEVPEYSFILHDRETEAEEGSDPMQQLHTHVVLPGTAPLAGEDREAFYNNKERGHDSLFREIASRHFSDALDRIVGPEWQLQRDEPEVAEPSLPSIDDFDEWFP